MKKLTIEEVKKRELELLLTVDRFCRKNQIKYFLNYGTLIGSVRHQGFIPWDDDIDLMMPREDYQRFIQTFSSEHCKLLSLASDEKYYNNFVKIIDSKTVIHDTRNRKTYDSGVFIDIFPYDRIDDLAVVEQTYKLESFKLLSFSKHKNIVYGDSWLKDAIRTFFWTILTPVSPRFFAYKIDTAVQHSYRVDGKWEGLLASKLKDKEIFEAGVFDELMTGEFEGYSFPIPKNYDAILTQYYGNYMELPPKEKQTNPHEIEVFLKEEE